MSKFQEEPLVLPFLWAQDGFSEPSKVTAVSSFSFVTFSCLSESLHLNWRFSGEEMAHKIATGLKVPGLATVSYETCIFWILVCAQVGSTDNYCSGSQSWQFQPAGAFFLVLGLIMLASTLAWSTWARCYIEPLVILLIAYLLTFSGFILIIWFL